MIHHICIKINTFRNFIWQVSQNPISTSQFKKYEKNEKNSVVTTEITIYQGYLGYSIQPNNDEIAVNRSNMKYDDDDE